MTLDELITQHTPKIALQFSGGRDSLAMLLYLRPYWDRLTVYYCNSGDAYPETLALVDAVRAVLPRFVEIPGRVQQVREQHGWCSDVVVPHTNLIDRVTCCYLSLMQPTHERMKADGITLIFRGQRLEDAVKSPVESGTVIDGVHIVYPLNDWTTEQVDAFIAQAGVSLPPYYAEGLTSAPDCMHCTAWLEHKAHKYLSKHHPEIAAEVQRRLQMIKITVQPFMRALDETLETA